MCRYPAARPQVLFTDVALVADKELAWDVLSDSYKAVPSVDVLSFGWVCSDKSFLNVNRKKFVTDYWQGSSAEGQSATTLRHCLAYVRKHRPRLVVSENLFTNDANEAEDCGESTLQFLLRTWEDMGYAAVPLVLHAEELGAGSCRRRLYICAWIGNAPANDAAISQATSLIQAIQTHSPKKRVQDLLRPPASSMVTEWLQHRATASRESKRAKINFDDHDQYFAEAGWSGPRIHDQLIYISDLDELSLLPLNERQRDVLFYLMVCQPPPATLSQDDLIMYDVFHSLEFLKNSRGVLNGCGTVCPNSILFARGGRQNRLVTPIECFSLMGYDLAALGIGDLPLGTKVSLEPPCWTWSAAQDLIGNAFEAHSCLTACIVLFCLAQ